MANSPPDDRPLLPTPLNRLGAALGGIALMVLVVVMAYNDMFACPSIGMFFAGLLLVGGAIFGWSVENDEQDKQNTP